MADYLLTQLTGFSPEALDPIRELERICRETDGTDLRIGLDNLTADSSDRVYLYQTEGRLIGYFSWYSVDGIEANISAMVHPQRRRQGIFRALLEAAAKDMRKQGIQACRFKVPADSDAGQHTMEHLGTKFDKSQYAMEFQALHREELRNPNLVIRPETLEDFGFMVRCSTQAFGDSEEWTLRYFGNTREPHRHAYIGFDGAERVGMIRVKLLGSDTAVIHDFCVSPDIQGRGYGRDILMQTVRLLLSEGRTRIRLSVITENRSALELYRRIGFGIVSKSDYYICNLEAWR